ncbi:hypothetical protein PP298_15580 [Mycobacteroides abscessus]|uniref:hypothetical protein n=1 Tax=Mycobacteroides abscessus TaxID=36809 RepID=UPI00078B70C3|nr:hypothetical protein [Mycobacteroides abscessus]AMU70629.1 hypothetical protein A3O05_11670 [Mycobacteroides abscessus]MDM2016778.1 hypothetical protein [Mycobacteroides abscessus]MDM2020650.1 hypothetical protein [Mycobacteroides abscessus]MDM2025453.1 hypothetical protein [Mycobacteroides abscessus]MDM2029052.1 hypothetical protein [Mycobacteroides abscessus]
MNSQVQCRVLDVALRELLRNVFALPHHAKPQWRQVAAIFTLKDSWQHLERTLKAVPMPKREDADEHRDGFFWSTMLAALSKATIENHPGLLESVFVDRPIDGGKKIQKAVTDVVNEDRDFFAALCIPGVTTPKVIGYIERPEADDAVETVAEMLGDAILRAAQLVPEHATDGEKRSRAADCLFLLQTVGAVSSLDLWHHPAAVRYLLLPAVAGIETRHRQLDHPEPDAGFSFDTGGHTTTKKLIYTEVAAPWRLKQHWGATRDEDAERAMEEKISADKTRARQQAKTRNDTAKKLAALESRVESLQHQIDAITARLDRE